MVLSYCFFYVQHVLEYYLVSVQVEDTYQLQVPIMFAVPRDCFCLSRCD